MAHQQTTGALMTHAHNQPEVLVGAGTLALAVEPAAALPLAAPHSRRHVPRVDENVRLIICGANVDAASLA